MQTDTDAKLVDEVMGERIIKPGSIKGVLVRDLVSLLLSCIE